MALKIDWFLNPRNTAVSQERVEGTPGLGRTKRIGSQGAPVGKKAQQAHLCDATKYNGLFTGVEPLLRRGVMDVFGNRQSYPDINVR